MKITIKGVYQLHSSQHQHSECDTQIVETFVYPDFLVVFSMLDFNWVFTNFNSVYINMLVFRSVVFVKTDNIHASQKPTIK